MDWPVNVTPDQVFSWAYKRFEWHADAEIWVWPEFWAAPDELAKDAGEHNGVVFGDCDDFAGMCVHALRSNGFPARYVVVKTEQCPANIPYDHCVAESDGQIFDCRYGQGTQSRGDLEAAGYTFVQMSGLAPDDPWTEVL